MKRGYKIFLYLFLLGLIVEASARLAGHFLLGTPLVDIRRVISDEHLIWKFNPGYTGPLYTYRYAHINRQGHLGEDLMVPKKDGEIRVVVLGGSVAFGLGVADMQENLCSQLQINLQQSSPGKNYTVINAGVPGYSSWNGRQFVERDLAKLQPDVLIVAFGWNDSMLDWGPDSDPSKGQKNAYYPVEPFPCGYSVIAHYIRQGWLKFAWSRGWYKPLPDERRWQAPVRVPVAEFRANLAAMKSWCDRAEVKLFFFTEPEAKLSEGHPITRGHASYLEAMRQIAAELQVPLADIALEFARLDSRALFADPQQDFVHPDARGQKEMARIIYERMQEAGYAIE